MCLHLYSLTGVQIEMAKMINVAVVNVQWLNDIISGAQSSSCMAINERYFQFNKNDPFRVNYGILSDLMGTVFRFLYMF